MQMRVLSSVEAQRVTERLDKVLWTLWTLLLES
jgi:hypothetical protein